MDQATHNKIVSFIWGIADDVLRDLKSRNQLSTLSKADALGRCFFLPTWRRR